MDIPVITPAEKLRYSRHIKIPEFNLDGQKKLKQSKVLVIGAGGLGSPLLLYLAAAGIGTLGIVDGDKVDISNLQRQVLYASDQVGLAKAAVAARQVEKINPFVKVNVHEVFLNTSNALNILADYDVIVDGTDNFPTRYLVNDACVILSKPLVYGSIYQFEGQVSVFNMQDSEGGRGPNYRDLFPEPPPPGMVPSCAEGGVLGVLPGIIGSMQANEAIKIITGIGETLSGRLFIFDALQFKTVTLQIKKNDELPAIQNLIDYEAFCGSPNPATLSRVREMSPEEFRKTISDNKDSYQLLDVREPEEYVEGDLGGTKIPLAQLGDRTDEVAEDKKVIVYCRSGVRSAQAIIFLQKDAHRENLYNLKGGIQALHELEE